MSLDRKGCGLIDRSCVFGVRDMVFFLGNEVSREGVLVHAVREHYLFGLISFDVLAAEEEEGEDEEDQCECKSAEGDSDFSSD